MLTEDSNGSAAPTLPLARPRKFVVFSAADLFEVDRRTGAAAELFQMHNGAEQFLRDVSQQYQIIIIWPSATESAIRRINQLTTTISPVQILSKQKFSNNPTELGLIQQHTLDTRATDSHYIIVVEDTRFHHFVGHERYVPNGYQSLIRCNYVAFATPIRTPHTYNAVQRALLAPKLVSESQKTAEKTFGAGGCTVTALLVTVIFAIFAPSSLTVFLPLAIIGAVVTIGFFAYTAFSCKKQTAEPGQGEVHLSW